MCGGGDQKRKRQQNRDKGASQQENRGEETTENERMNLNAKCIGFRNWEEHLRLLRGENVDGVCG